MQPLWFTRARLRREGSAAALAPLLFAPGRLDQGHALVWSLFADAADRRRDFLWREIGQGLFYILSARLPRDAHALFDMDPPKEFAPDLAAGEVLRFSLRANPVVRRSTGEPRAAGRGFRVRKHDVVMDALKHSSGRDRAEARFAAIGTAGFAWLKNRGAVAGFRVEPGEVAVEGYNETEIRRRNGPPIRFCTLDFDGRLTVTDPRAFISALAQGFGSARAFGCGLMLIRRG